jgi:hypothetical protein
MDKAYQRAVDSQAAYLLHKEAQELRVMPESGTFNTFLANELVQGVWEHFSFTDGTHHVLFQLDRTAKALFLTKYLSGVKVLPTGEVVLLTTQELGYYEL